MAATVWSPVFRRPWPGKPGTPSKPGCSAGFASWFVFTQASFVQTDTHVGGGAVNQRRRQLVEPDSTRLPLLVATAADGVRLVGGQKSRMVQAFFCRV